MKRAPKIVGATAAVAAGPSGVRRLLAGCLMIVLLGGLALGGFLAFAAWTAQHSNQAPSALPCPPATVAVAVSTQVAPKGVREAVEQALRQAGREPVKGGWGGEERRDLVVVWSPGSTTSVSRSSDPVKITLGAVPSAAEVTEVLGGRLAPCAAPAKPSAAPAPVEAQEPAQSAPGGTSWPWERGWGVTGWLALTVALWWLAGPNMLRWGWASLWPLRLAWRTAQRSIYQRAIRRGVLPREWPLRVTPGQRWHESAEAMHDHRTHRAQTRKSEPARRKALWASIREERLEGTGIGPASLWRRIYHTPAPQRVGAPESEGVSS